MRILFLTPGTGSYYCGVCMRDNALAKQLISMGHDAVLLPLYLPLTLEEDAASPDVPVFFGGLNVYLQQKFEWFRRAPRWLDQWIDHPRLLKFLGRFSGMTQGAEIGALTLSMLKGEEGAQSREVEKLVEWMTTGEKPDVVWLSTGLLAGVARRIKAVTGVPVFCSLQGEDSFLDGLPDPWRKLCWEEMGRRCMELNALVAPSRFFAERMEVAMGFPRGSLCVIPNGMSFDGYEELAHRPQLPVVGYLARFTHGKGLGTVVEAFIELRKRGRVDAVKLHCVGTMIPGDMPYLEAQKQRLRDAGLERDAVFEPNVSREEKITFLNSLSLLSVPASYGEAFGLYLIEAFACGVPVVQPRTASFPEIVEATGGGVIVVDSSPEALALAWEELLLNPDHLAELGENARAGVRSLYSMEKMATSFLALIRDVVSSGAQ
ncbi:MAG: glycosyltransferase family 4 protein [Verrucomicrobiota bacterium]